MFVNERSETRLLLIDCSSSMLFRTVRLFLLTHGQERKEKNQNCSSCARHTLLCNIESDRLGSARFGSDVPSAIVSEPLLVFCSIIHSFIWFCCNCGDAVAALVCDSDRNRSTSTGHSVSQSDRWHLCLCIGPRRRTDMSHFVASESSDRSCMFTICKWHTVGRNEPINNLF